MFYDMPNVENATFFLFVVESCCLKRYKDSDKWAKMALSNVAHVGKFSSDRTIQEYVDDIWHLDKLEL